MSLYKIKKLDKHIYTVEVSSWILGMQLYNMKEFTHIGGEKNIYSFKVIKNEPNSGEHEFLKILKANGLDLDAYIHN